MMRRLAVPALVLAACLLAARTQARADTLTGEVRGTVLDVEGRAPLAGVAVTLIHDARGRKKETRTDAAGEYRFLQLEPGDYTLVFEQEGYYRLERPDVGVRLNQLKVVIPPLELRKRVATPTRIETLRGEQTKTAVIDLTAPGPTPVVLAFLSEPGRTALVSLVDSALRFNFEGALLRRLPLGGARSFDSLALLAPGVFRVPFSSGTGPAVGIGVGSAGEFSVNGMRGRSNNFTVDGSDNNDEEIGVRRQGFISVVPQSGESIEEFQVLTAGFPAEFGRSAGAMVNAVSRSGEKKHHGSVYGYVTGSRMSARDAFERPFTDTVNRGAANGGEFSDKDQTRALYGAVIGGPLRSDRMFYFGSIERRTESGTALRDFVVPSTAERGLRTQSGFVPIEQLGSFFADRAFSYSDSAGKGVFGLYPLPNDPDGPFGRNTYTEARPYHGGGMVYSIKVDRYLSRAHSFFARYNFTDDRMLLPFTSDAIHSSLQTSTRTQNLSLFLNSTTPGLANSLRVSFGRTRLYFPPDEGSPLLFGSPATQGVSTRTIETAYGRFGPFGATGAIGQLSIQPYSTIGIDVFNFPQARVDNTLQASDFVTRARGSHTWKFGLDFRRSQLNSFADRNSRPLVLFTPGQVSLTCQFDPFCPFATSDGLLRGTDLAALGAPGGFLQALSTGPAEDSHIGLRLARYELFVADTWKARPNLTIDLGLRWELETVPHETNGRIERSFGLRPADFAHLQPTGSVGDQRIIEAGNVAFDRALNALNGFIAGRDRIYDADRNNFAPRIGFAWDPRRDGKTAVRASFTLSYDANLGAVTSHSRNVFPTFVPLNLDPNFLQPNGRVLNSPIFLEFIPTGERLVRPGTLNSYNLTGNAFATGLGTLLAQAPASPLGNLSSNSLAFTLPEKLLPSSSAGQAQVSLERQFGESYLATVGYVGTRGKHLAHFATPNAGLISTPVLFSSFDTPLQIFDFNPSIDDSGLRPHAGLGAYTTIENSASSAYDSLQLQFARRARKGPEWRASWTWSHALDEVSDPFDGRGFFALPQQTLAPGLERASASFDARHRVTAFVVWDVPAWRDRSLLRGWTVSAIAELQTGQPFTVNTSSDRNRDGNLTDRLDSSDRIAVRHHTAQLLGLEPGADPATLVAAAGRDGRVGRNTFRADGIATVDAALSRTLALAERTKLDLRLEVFNLFNRTHFGIPIRILESPGFGRSFDTHVSARNLRLAARILF